MTLYYYPDWPETGTHYAHQVCLCTMPGQFITASVPMCVGQRNRSPPFTVKEVPSVELRPSGLHTHALTTLSHLTGFQLLTFTSLLSHTIHHTHTKYMYLYLYIYMYT